MSILQARRPFLHQGMSKVKWLWTFFRHGRVHRNLWRPFPHQGISYSVRWGGCLDRVISPSVQCRRCRDQRLPVANLFRPISWQSEIIAWWNKTSLLHSCFIHRISMFPCHPYLISCHCSIVITNIYVPQSNAFFLILPNFGFKFCWCYTYYNIYSRNDRIIGNSSFASMLVAASKKMKSQGLMAVIPCFKGKKEEAYYTKLTFLNKK